MSLAIIQLVLGSEESQPHTNEKTKSRAQLETGRGQGIPSVGQENLSLSPPPLCASCVTVTIASIPTTNKTICLTEIVLVYNIVRIP